MVQPLLTSAEAIAAAAFSLPAFAIGLAYFADRAGARLAPFWVLAFALAGTAAVFIALRRRARPDPDGLAAFVGVVGLVLAWLIWLGWPGLLPMGGGADLVHHLQLIDYIERHLGLPRDPAVEAYLGEMAHYTPGSHLLAVVAGALAGADGFHAYHPVASLTIALKAGIVFLIALRVVPPGVPRVPVALTSVLLLHWPLFYFVGSITRYSYFAQVVAEVFAVAMWWSAVAWDEWPSRVAALLFAVSGVATFLTWPIWIGPPVAAFVLTSALRRETPLVVRVGDAAIAVVPIVVAAAAHAAGRLGWFAMAQAAAEIRVPRPADFGWVFLGLAGAGALIALRDRSGRAPALFAAAIGAQTGALYVLSAVRGADSSPYMAIKMVHLALYPAAVFGALAIGGAWRLAAARTTATPAMTSVVLPRAVAWTIVAAAVLLAARHVAAMPVQPMTVSGPLYEAGRWARAHAPPECVDYLVANEQTAYWLHLAVLGSRRLSARTADDRTFAPTDTILRWINRTGMPYAVADMATLPRDIREEVVELARFDSAAVVQHPASTCPTQ